MGNSCVAGACRGSNQATFQWTIDGFSSLLEKGKGPTYSSVFQMRGLDWYLKLNPGDTKSGDQNEYVSLRLKLTEGSVRSDRVVETTFKFLIYDQLYGKHHEQQVSHNFQKKSTSSGTSCMIPLAALKENSEVVCSEEEQPLCSEPQVYTWNIENFNALENPSYSPEFELCGHKWSIKIYPSGDDTNGNYISLYLVMVSDILRENSTILIEKTMCIKGQETGKGLRGKGRIQYSKDSYMWGWSKFISLEDFKDPTNGYLMNTKCCVEVQVAVIGSSRMK